MPRVQVYISDQVVEKINAIIESRRVEGAKDKDVNFSSISSMLSCSLRDWGMRSLQKVG